LNGLGGGLENKEVIGGTKILLVTHSKSFISPKPYTLSSLLDIDDVTEAMEDDEA
jgi:hypothetical protein